MSKFFDWLVEVLPSVWGILWIIIITGISVGGVIWVYQWIMRLVGAM